MKALALTTAGVLVVVILGTTFTGMFLAKTNSLSGKTMKSSSTIETTMSSISQVSFSSSKSQSTTSTTSQSSLTMNSSQTETIPLYSVSPRLQTTTTGKANITACISVPTTEFFNVNLISPNGTVIFVDSMSPNTVNNFTFSNGTWCKAYSVTLKSFGTWTAQAGFVLGPSNPIGYTASAIIDYQQSLS